MSYILENWINKSLSLYITKNQQDTAQHNVQVIDILGNSRSLKQQKMILSDGQYFILAYVKSSLFVNKESFINIKKFYIDYYDGKFVLFVSDYVLIGGVSDLIRNPTDVNKKYSKYLNSRLYLSVNEYLLFGNEFTEDSIFENILVHENNKVREIDYKISKDKLVKEINGEKKNVNKDKLVKETDDKKFKNVNKEIDYKNDVKTNNKFKNVNKEIDDNLKLRNNNLEKDKLNTDNENTNNIFSSSLILSTYENKYDLFLDKSLEDPQPSFDTHDVELSSVIDNTQICTNTEESDSSLPLWSSDMSNISFISPNTQFTPKNNFLFISDKSFTETPLIHKRSLKNHKKCLINKNRSVDYRIKRGSFDLQVLKYSDQIKKIQKIFYKNTQFKYTTRNRNKYFNLENNTKLVYDSKDINEYSFLSDKEDIMFDIYFDIFN